MLKLQIPYPRFQMGYLVDSDWKRLYETAINVSKQINGFIDYLKGTEKVGQKKYK